MNLGDMPVICSLKFVVLLILPNFTWPRYAITLRAQGSVGDVIPNLSETKIDVNKVPVCNYNLEHYPR